MSNIQQMADRANLAYSAEPGFVRCRVAAENPPILAYEFVDQATAQEFQFKLELMQVRRAPDPRDPMTVLQYVQ